MIIIIHQLLAKGYFSVHQSANNRKIASLHSVDAGMDDAETTLRGSAFQMLAMTTGKARLPTVDGLKEGTALQQNGW